VEIVGRRKGIAFIRRTKPREEGRTKPLDWRSHSNRNLAGVLQKHPSDRKNSSARTRGGSKKDCAANRKKTIHQMNHHYVVSRKGRSTLAAVRKGLLRKKRASKRKEVQARNSPTGRVIDAWGDGKEKRHNRDSVRRTIRGTQLHNLDLTHDSDGKDFLNTRREGSHMARYNRRSANWGGAGAEPSGRKRG